MTATQIPTSVPAARPTVAEGPMPKGGRWEWYQESESGPWWQPMTNVLKNIETDQYNLEQWKLRQVLEGAALRPDIIVGVRGIGRPGPDGHSKDAKKELNGLVRKAMEAAKVSDGAVLGNAMHRATERIDRGELLEAVNFPEPYASSLRAYAALRSLNGWRSVEIERTVRVDELGKCAGTFDRIDEIPGLAAKLGPCCAGHGLIETVISDVKTEADPFKNLIHIVPQLAGYANGRAMWSTSLGEWVPMPPVRCDVAIMVHVRDGHATPCLLDIRQGWEATRAAAAQRDRMKASKIELGNPGCWAVPLPVAAPPPVLPSVAFVERLAAKDPQVQAAAIRTLGLDEPPRTELGVPGGAFLRNVQTVLSGIYRADDRETLHEVYEWARSVGRVPWAGDVQAAGARRLAIVECPQRALHTEGMGAAVLCACGWTSGRDKP